MKRIAWITALVLGTLAGLVVLWQFRQALVIFLLSLATSAALRPVITRLTRRGFKPGLALILTYLMLFLLVGGLFVIISRSLLGDLEQMTNNLTSAYETITHTWPESDDEILKAISGQLPPVENLLEALSGQEGQQALQEIIGSASSLAGFFSQLVVIIILSLYWSADRVHFERLWLSLIPVDQRTRARAAWQAVESGVGDYILSEVIQSYLVVVILWLGFTWIGLPQPTLMALICALAWFIPWLGAVLAIIPVIVVGLTASPAIAVTAGLLTVATLLMMEVVIQPRFFLRQRFNSLLLALVVIMLAQVSGIIGLVLAPVLVAALQFGFQYFSTQREIEITSNQVNDEFAELRASLESVQTRLQAEGPEYSPELNSLVERLQSLLEKTTQYLRTRSFTRYLDR